MLDEFLLKSVVFKLILKEISRAEHEYNALATALHSKLDTNRMRMLYITHNTNALKQSNLATILLIWFVFAEKFEANVYITQAKDLYPHHFC